MKKSNLKNTEEIPRFRDCAGKGVHVGDIILIAQSRNGGTAMKWGLVCRILRAREGYPSCAVVIAGIQLTSYGYDMDGNFKSNRRSGPNTNSTPRQEWFFDGKQAILKGSIRMTHTFLPSLDNVPDEAKKKLAEYQAKYPIG